MTVREKIDNQLRKWTAEEWQLMKNVIDLIIQHVPEDRKNDLSIMYHKYLESNAKADDFIKWKKENFYTDILSKEELCDDREKESTK